MAKLTSTFPLILLLFPLYSLTLTLIAQPISSSSVISNTPNFDSQITLLGAAADVGSHVTLTRASSPRAGLLLRRKGFNLSSPLSFSSELVFSITPGTGSGIMVVFSASDLGSMFSGEGLFGFEGETRFVGVEFDSEMNRNANDVNANHVGVNLGSFDSVIVGNVSDSGLVLNSGEKMRSWIDYDASSKRLEVRLSKVGESRPYDPIVAYSVDLMAMWKDEDVYVGVCSLNSNGSAMQISSVYSWSFRVRNIPRTHSLPVDLRSYLDGEDGEDKRKACPMSILEGVIFMTGCGALVSFVVLFLWAIVANRHTVFPPEVLGVFPVKASPTDFRYEKISVVVEVDGVKK